VPDNKQLIGLMIAVIIGATLLSPFVAAVTQNTGTVSITDEHVSAKPGTYQDLTGYNLNSGETVTWYNSTSASNETLTASDYSINSSTGKIQLNNPPVQSGDDVWITYDYAATSGTTTTVVKLAPLFLGLLMLVYMAAQMTDSL